MRYEVMQREREKIKNDEKYRSKREHCNKKKRERSEKN